MEVFFTSFEGQITGIVLGIALLVQIYYYLFVFSKLAFHKPVAGGGKKEPVSVIICARNELKNLKRIFLSFWIRIILIFRW
ncbi:MAG: hypothetical protein IPP71_12270 [Bacteroidetes bacterium]|nr:hypothetical protein [Bacteroidota bacterium]